MNLDPPFTNITFTQFLLEKLKVALTLRFPAELVHSMNIRVVEPDFFTDSVVVELACDVLGERVDTQTVNGAKAIHFSWPASWWQHWKHDHRATWYGRRIVARWPVREQQTSRMVQMTVPIERWRTFPEATGMAYPPYLGRPVNRLVPGVVTWSEEC